MSKKELKGLIEEELKNMHLLKGEIEECNGNSIVIFIALCLF